jgi:hypothetical protein
MLLLQRFKCDQRDAQFLLLFLKLSQFLIVQSLERGLLTGIGQQGHSHLLLKRSYGVKAFLVQICKAAYHGGILPGMSSAEGFPLYQHIVPLAGEGVKTGTNPDLQCRDGDRAHQFTQKSLEKKSSRLYHDAQT